MIELGSIINQLSQFITEERFELFKEVLNNRTRYITVALEDIFQPHNASAVLRTADCFGIQDVHIIENKNVYDINPDVALGSYKWVKLIKHNAHEHNTLDAINYLKSDGYRIVATTPHTNNTLLGDFDLLPGKVALFFGTELKGLSQVMLDNADEYLKIPMFGFTESFNISVSASIILHTLTQKLRQSSICWHLSANEQEKVLFQWLMNTIKKSDTVLKNICSRNNLNMDYFKEFL